MDIIPSTAPKSFTSDTTFSNYFLIVDAYSKIPKLYGMEKITTEEVMDKLCTVYFRAKEKNAVTLTHSAQRKHAFWGEIKEMSKTRNYLLGRKFL